MDNDNTILYYIGRFMHALVDQLNDDFKRHGNAWSERPVSGQEERIFVILNGYFHNFKQSGVPIPWLKVAGLALIGWAREQRERL